MHSESERKSAQDGLERFRVLCCGVTRWTRWQNQCQKLTHHITLDKEKKEKRGRNRPHGHNRNEDAIHHVDLETIIGYTVTNHRNMSRIHNDTESDGK